jgi:hypothetical protein
MKHPEDPLARALADLARAEGQELEEAARAHPDLATFDAAETQRLTAMVAAELARGRTTAVPESAEVVAPPAPPPVRRRRPLSSWSFILGGTALAAAAAALVLVQPDHGGTPLPTYTLLVAGGDSAQRSGTDRPPAVLRLRSDGEVDIVLTPATDVQASLRADGFVLPSARGARPLGVRPEVSPAGAVRLSGTVAALFPRDLAGAVTLVLVLRVERDHPPDPARLAEGTSPSGPGWRRYAIPVELAR